ncbi:MAG: FHA domain-containing serine/threonine-protein kinase [Candidatus Methanofastidiosia archaeon]|jgi:serine/threonine protein kinase
MKLRPGTIIHKRYRIENKIYEGGMGVVYICMDIYARCYYVIKHPLLNGEYDDKKVEKLETEAKILRSLSHPHIVKYVTSFQGKKMYYLITEYIKGNDMKKLFLNRPATETMAKKYGGYILNGLEYLHNRNIIHRDIKPRNIMVSNKTVKLIDFGGAKMWHTGLNKEKTYLWTPGYGAPEQHKGEVYFQSDIYAVGATMYFLLTGKDPSAPPPLSPRIENWGVDRALDSIVQKATNIDPNKRFQTATEMKNALFGIYKNPKYPRLIIGSREFRITRSPFTIGRGGSTVRPDILINDPKNYLSKVHAQIFKSSGRYWIKDCSLNGTFIYIGGSYQQKSQWNLQDNDLIALCCSATKGPYLVLKFKM